LALKSLLNAGAEATAHFTRRLNASILAIGARETAAHDASRAAIRTSPPAVASVTQEQ
jgi:hypothetical protein